MTKKNKNNKHRRQTGSRAAQVAAPASAARSSSDTIRPCRRQTPSEDEISKTSTGTSSSPTNEGAESSGPGSHIETASEDMETPKLGGQTAESSSDALVSASVDEQSEDSETRNISFVSPPDTTPSDGATAPEGTGKDPLSPSTAAQPETSAATVDEQQASESGPPTTLASQPDEAEDRSAEGDVGMGTQPPSGDTTSGTKVATDDEAQPMDFDTGLEAALQIEKGREAGQMHDDNTENGIMAKGASELDAAGKREEEDSKENGEDPEDPGTEQTLFPSVQEPPDLEQPKSQELQLETKNSSHIPLGRDPETPPEGLQAAVGKLDGLSARRPSANNLTIAVDSQPNPATAVNGRHRTARDLLLQKSHLLGEDARISMTLKSIANYIDGVGGMPSREEMEEFDEFRAFTAQRAKILEEALDGGEPLAAMRRFDERWGQRAMDDAWGARQDLRLAAVRAALHYKHDFGSIQAELAILYFEHRVVSLRKRLGDDLDDPVALQTLDILGSAAGGR